jgi:ribose transport system permease protein
MRLRLQGNLTGKSNVGLYAVLAILLLAALVINFVTGVNFYKITNLLNVARSFSLLGIASIGETLVIISGGLDLSVGSVISTSNVFAATFMNGKNALLLPVTLLTLSFGAFIGLINGILVTKRNVPPFIATLGLSIILTGAKLMWTKGLPRGRVPPALIEIGVGTGFGVPNLLYVFLFVALLMTFMLSRCAYGRRLYAVGVNKEVSTLSGIRTGLVVTFAYVACGALSSLVGVLFGGYMGMSDQLIGQGYDLDSIAASVLGGAVIGGGFGSVSGTTIGVVIMLIITNLSLLAHFPIQSQMLIKGVLIVFALSLNGRRRPA